jgi:putative phosphonate metabolism protein
LELMASFPRYAIYYASAPGTALDRFGAGLLGYDARSGEDLPFPDDVLRAAPDWHALTQDPRKYGFHATLKAPLALAQGKTEAELLGACADFADRARPAPVITPVVGSISGFIAVIPKERTDELERFAADCVTAFDSFRAPLTATERARRNPQRLTPRQCAYLDRWGYPYVMDEFRFHMTLTGRLDPSRREAVLAMLRDRFATIGLERLAIDSIAVFCQHDSAARFRILGEWKLRVLP